MKYQDLKQVVDVRIDSTNEMTTGGLVASGI